MHLSLSWVKDGTEKETKAESVREREALGCEMVRYWEPETMFWDLHQLSFCRADSVKSWSVPHSQQILQRLRSSVFLKHVALRDISLLCGVI